MRIGPLIWVSLGFSLAVVFAEAVLRLLPVSTGYDYMPLNSHNPVLRGTPHVHYTYSLGWNFRLADHGSLNNDGFIATRDYRRGDTAPVLLIGDSYVQAAAVRPDRNLHALLSERLQPVEVFGLGRAGGALPDYVAMARWGIDRYRPAALVFLIVVGDVDDSLSAKAGGYYFTPGETGLVESRLDRPALTGAQKTLNHSMLFRYLYDNLAFTVNFALRSAPQQGVVVSREPQVRRRTSAFFLDELERSFPRERMILLIHRARRGGSFMYDADVNVLSEMAESRGFRVVDLAASFEAYERQTGIHLDFAPVDTHWNEAAHRLVAGELEPLLKNMLAR